MADYHLGDKDPAMMLRWLRASACQGYPIAQASLGVLYDAGDGVPQDAFMAYAWWTWAGRQGDPEAAQFADSLYAAVEDDERAFAEALAQQGWAATPDCRNRSPSGGGGTGVTVAALNAPAALTKVGRIQSIRL
ncbi:MAG: sel1 repeat family protein [Candidatus Competibacteraceae bacterium]|nr:sel1 repeat family protein [Candidatus Competibacteraceae bacterium]MCB1820640.1 sel1 repeat family protein [Candidatus Competibacteraceae bacterium]